MNYSLTADLSCVSALYYFGLYSQTMGWNEPDAIVIDVVDIYDAIVYPEHEFSLKMDIDLGMHHDKKVLGKTIMEDKLILIDRSIAPETNDPRFAFTLAHEIGHALLHQHKKGQLFRCTSSTFSNKYDSFEREANSFAAHLLMPAMAVLYRFIQCYEKHSPYIYNGPGVYFINHEKVIIRSLSHLCSKLAAPLTQFFSNVSKESLGYRLHNIGLIDNQTKEKIGSKEDCCSFNHD